MTGEGGPGDSPGDGRRGKSAADPLWTEVTEAPTADGRAPQGPSAYHFLPPPPDASSYPPQVAYAYPPPPYQAYPPPPYPAAPYPPPPYPPAPYPPALYPPPPYYASGYYQPYGQAQGNPMPAKIGGALSMGCGVLALVLLIVPELSGGLPFLCMALEVGAALLAILGGLNAFQTRHYGFAVLGAVATIALAPVTVAISFILGLAALILIAVGRDAFLPTSMTGPLFQWGGRWV